MSLHFNPNYDKLLPRMSDDEYTQLKASIKAEGQHYPIIVNEDLEILDGHHRFRACTELGFEPDFEVRKFDDKLLEKKFVIEANLRRRHLNNFQLIELGVPLLEVEKSLAKKRQANGGIIGRNLQLGIVSHDSEVKIEPVIRAKSTEVVAKKVGVSTRTFERGKKIIEKASEDEKQKLREGKTSISKVYQEIVTSEKPKEKEITQTAENVLSVQEVQNKNYLVLLLDRMMKHEVFCPRCRNNMLECSKCHRTIEALLKVDK